MSSPVDPIRALVLKPVLGLGAGCFMSSLMISYALGVGLSGVRHLGLSPVPKSPVRTRPTDHAEPNRR